MALKDAVRTAVETIVPPSAADLRQRLETARQALLQAQEADQAARAAQDVAFGADDDKVAQKAQADAVQARLALERAAGRVAALERQLAAAEAAQADAELETGRKRLAALKTEREQRGAQILKALDALQAAVAGLVAVDDKVMALPPAVRGTNATPGYLLGSGPLAAHLAVELEQRAIIGQPSSMERPTLAQWLATGSRTLP